MCLLSHNFIDEFNINIKMTVMSVPRNNVIQLNMVQFIRKFGCSTNLFTTKLYYNSMTSAKLYYNSMTSE